MSMPNETPRAACPTCGGPVAVDGDGREQHWYRPVGGTGEEATLAAAEHPGVRQIVEDVRRAQHNYAAHGSEWWGARADVLLAALDDGRTRLAHLETMVESARADTAEMQCIADEARAALDACRARTRELEAALEEVADARDRKNDHDMLHHGYADGPSSESIRIILAGQPAAKEGTGDE